MRSISTSTTSPSRSQRGGRAAAPTPAGVPVRITSPGSSVMRREAKAITSATGKIISLVRADCTVRPETRVRRPRSWGSGTASAVRSAGPRGQKVSQDFPMKCWPRTFWKSRALTSLAAV